MILDARIGIERDAFTLGVELAAAAGETLAVVGPNGAGKTTLLRALAGLAPLDRGAIRLDGRVLDDPAAGVWVAPEARPIGVAFQDQRLFPHLDALSNVAFGLRAHGVARREAEARARQWLARVGVEAVATRRPQALSGGEAQRVALARALVLEPRLLLLDEPLSAVDAASRDSLRRDLAVLLREQGGAAVVVTHDAIEAVALGTRLAVIEGGRVVQEGVPGEIAACPRSEYVAALIGVNLWRGRAEGQGIVLEGGGRVVGAHPADGRVLVVVHPRAVSLHRERPSGSPRNVWRGSVESVERMGDVLRVRVRGEVAVVAEVTPGAASELGVAPGAQIWASVKATEVQVLPA